MMVIIGNGIHDAGKISRHPVEVIIHEHDQANDQQRKDSSADDGRGNHPNSLPFQPLAKGHEDQGQDSGDGQGHKDRFAEIQDDGCQNDSQVDVNDLYRELTCHVSGYAIIIPPDFLGHNYILTNTLERDE